MGDDKRQMVSSVLMRLNILCAAIAGSVVLYVTVAFFVLRPGSGEAWVPEASTVLPLVLTAIAVSTLVAVGVIQRFLLARSLDVQKLPTPAQRIQVYQTGTFMVFAIIESIALTGLVASIVTGQALWCGALSAVALVAMLFSWPRRSVLRRVVDPTGPSPIGD